VTPVVRVIGATLQTASKLKRVSTYLINTNTLALSLLADHQFMLFNY
jgi:hypothetical protein